MRFMAQPSRVLTADRGDAGRRLDLVLRRHLTDVSAATRTRVQAWIEAGHVSLNGRTVHKPAARVALSDVVAITLPTPPRRRMTPEPLPLEVVFEDDHLLVVNKPAGLIVHPSYGHPSGTMMNGLLFRAQDWPHGLRPSLVGRLVRACAGGQDGRGTRRAATSPG